MPWKKNYDAAEVLDRAMHAFWAHGYEGTSIADLVTATGINRGSLYSAYVDKRDLFVASLKHYDRHYRADFFYGMAMQHPPKDAIAAVFHALANTSDPGRPKGCLMVNTALEVAPHDAGISALVNHSFDTVEAFFDEMIVRGQSEGTIRDTLDAKATAKALLCLFMGLRVATRSARDQETLDTITAQARAMLE